jgi:hypothetical protein
MGMFLTIHRQSDRKRVDADPFQRPILKYFERNGKGEIEYELMREIKS